MSADRVAALAEGMCARASSPCGQCQANAERLLDSPAMRDLLAAERARALREAASAMEDGPLIVNNSVAPPGRTFYADWLRARADRERP